MTGGVAPFLAFVASHRLHASATLISLITAATWAGASMSLIWANAIHGKSKMRFVTNSWIVGRSIFALMLFATTPLRFAVVAIVGQFIGTIALPGYTSIVRAMYPREHRARLMGYVRVAIAITATATTFIVGPILKTWDSGYRFIFAIASVFGVASAVIFRSIRLPADETESGSDEDRPPLPQFLRDSLSILKRDKRFAWFLFATTVYGFGNFMATPVYPKFMDEILHMNEANLALYTVLSNVSLMVSYLYFGHYIDKRSPIRCTAVIILINAALPIIFFLSPFFVSAWPGLPMYLWILPGAIVTGIMMAGLELAYFNTVLRFAPQGQEMAYQGLQSGIQGLRGIAGPLTGGILYDVFRQRHYNADYVFLFSLALILVGLTLLVWGMRWKFRPAAAHLGEGLRPYC
jgi:MFS family permease